MAAAVRSSCRKAQPNNVGAAVWCWRRIRACSATPTPDGATTERVRALTVFLVNRRATVHRFYADVSYAFQARLELVCETGFRPRRDLSGYRAQDWDLRIADLHYRDMREWAVGRNAAAGWDAIRRRRRRGHARMDRSSSVGGGRTRCAE